MRWEVVLGVWVAVIVVLWVVVPAASLVVVIVVIAPTHQDVLMVQDVMVGDLQAIPEAILVEAGGVRQTSQGWLAEVEATFVGDVDTLTSMAERLRLLVVDMELSDGWNLLAAYMAAAAGVFPALAYVVTRRSLPVLLFGLMAIVGMFAAFVPGLVG